MREIMGREASHPGLRWPHLDERGIQGLTDGGCPQAGLSISNSASGIGNSDE